MTTVCDESAAISCCSTICLSFFLIWVRYE